jgi:hypothetical protein
LSPFVPAQKVALPGGGEENGQFLNYTSPFPRLFEPFYPPLQVALPGGGEKSGQLLN